MSYESMTKIPKIIHQIAPSNRDNWHPLWYKCQLSWIKLAEENGYEYKLWNDKEDLEKLIEEHYKPYLELFKSLPTHIMKIDFARFCILHQYGGIYADMDMFVYSDFYDTLYEDCMVPSVMLLGAPWGDVPIENALMISIPYAGFWVRCMKETQNNFNNISKITGEFHSKENQMKILNAAGPDTVYKTYSKNNRSIYILNGTIFNNHGLSYDKKFKTKHVMTGLWGDEAINDIKKLDMDYKEALKILWSKEVSKYVDCDINFDTFDFYTDYTDGKFLK